MDVKLKYRPHPLLLQLKVMLPLKLKKNARCNAQNIPIAGIHYMNVFTFLYNDQLKADAGNILKK